MSFITLLVELIVLGVVFYFVDQIPMNPVFKTAVQIVAVIFALLLILSAFGIAPLGVPTLR